MNLLTTNTAIMMSSKEIADLTGKRHDNVVRDIRSMIDQIHPSDLSHEQYQAVSDERGYTSFILLDHDLTILLLTGYDVKARLTVIKRWKELESKQPSFVIPTTLSGALLLAAKQAEQIEQQQLLIEQQKPAVDFVEGYVESRGTLSLRDAGKTLGWGQKAFIAMLMDDFLYRNKQGTLLPYAKFIKEEYFVVKTGSEHDHQFIQTRVTPKGMTFLANYLDTV